MEKWQSNLYIAVIAIVGLQLASADIDRVFYRAPVKAPEKVAVKAASNENQVQVVSKNDTIKNESAIDSKTAEIPGNAPVLAVTAESSSKLTLERLNTMNVSELEQINGVGPVLAKRILEYRQQHGVFKSLDGLTAVKGIGPKKLEKIKAQFKH